jgi:probable F420-dependent oxidoreductase
VPAVAFGVTLGSFGAGLVPGPTLVAWAEEIERLGFDSLWFRDHVVWWSPVLDPFTALGAIAARTRRLRLGPGVLLLPLRSPALVAKAVATLDHFSGGRAILGAGIGGEFPEEFEACGVPLRERGRRADEALEAIRALWTGAPASYAGQFFRFTDVVMEPRPVQSPHPPIWVGGRSDAALARAGRLGDGWIAYFVTPEGFRQRLDQALAARDRHGRGGREFGAGLVVYFRLAATREAAREEADRYLATEYRQPFGDRVDRYCAFGPPAECIATLRRFVEAGVREIVLIPTCPPALFMDQLRQAAAEVLPHVRPA